MTEFAYKASRLQESMLKTADIHTNKCTVINKG